MLFKFLSDMLSLSMVTNEMCHVYSVCIIMAQYGFEQHMEIVIDYHFSIC